MKKLLGVVVLVVLVVGAYKVFAGHSTRHACARIGDLCDADLSSSDLDQCVEQVDKLPAAEANKGIECVNESSSCAEAAGCIMGVVDSAIDKQLKKFDRGFDRGRNK